MTFFTEMEQIILIYYMESQRFRIAKAILKKRNKAESIAFPGFR